MNIFVKGIITLFKREVKIISGDLDLITIILLSPILYALFLGSIYINKSESNVPVVVIDLDKSNTSKTLIRNLDAHQLIKIESIEEDFSSAEEKIYSMDAMGIIYIPADFSSSLKSGNGTDLKIFFNTSRFLISNDMNKAVSEVTGTLGVGIRLKYFETQGYSFEQAKELVEPVRTEIRSLFNPAEGYGDFFLPGFLALVLQQTLLIGFAETIAKERKDKSLKHLYKLSGNSIVTLITGKGLFYLLIFCSYALLFYTAIFNLFKLNFSGSALAFSVITVLFLSSIICYCFFIASFFKEKIISLQIFAFTSIPLFLVSGYPWPFSAMPPFLVAAAQFLPATPYLNAMQRITQMGAGFGDVIVEIIHLAILLLFSMVILNFRIKVLLKETE